MHVFIAIMVYKKNLYHPDILVQQLDRTMIFTYGRYNHGRIVQHRQRFAGSVAFWSCDAWIRTYGLPKTGLLQPNYEPMTIPDLATIHHRETPAGFWGNTEIERPRLALGALKSDERFDKPSQFFWIKGCVCLDLALCKTSSRRRSRSVRSALCCASWNNRMSTFTRSAVTVGYWPLLKWLPILKPH